MNTPLNKSVLLTVLLTVLIIALQPLPVFSQIGYKSSDIITFTDYRWVYAADISPQTVYFATSNGVFRIDRDSGEPIDPWQSGHGFDQAVALRSGKAILWHNASRTLWLWNGSFLACYRWGIDRWDSIPFDVDGKVQALGESETRVIIKTSAATSQFAIINPFTFQVEQRVSSAPEGVRWNAAKPHEYKNYRPTDFRFWFDSDDGAITDERHIEYKPAFDIVDESYRRRYICYPGLGIGIADERHLDLEIIQPGPAGKNVKALAFVGKHFLWIGGENMFNDGLNLFDRQTGIWAKFDAGWVFGLESHHARDILACGNRIYFTTDAGLVVFNPENRRWKTLSRFDGLTGENLNSLAAAGGNLFIGGDQGVNRMPLPSGNLTPSGNETVDELRCGDMAADRDTVWIAGLQGVFRWSPDSWDKVVSRDEVIGNEAAKSLAVSASHLWIGGSRGIRGLNRRTGEWKGYQASLYLQGGLPFALAANDTLLWVGTDRGLFAMHVLKGSWLRYGKREGLPSERINCLTVESDTLWIGTPEGLTRFLWNVPGRDVF